MHPSSPCTTNCKKASQTITATPSFHPLSRLYIGWPTRPDTWRLCGVPARNSIQNFVQSILQNTTRVTVVLVTGDRTGESSARDQFAEILSSPNTSRFVVICIPSNDCWLQDIGPIFTKKPTGKIGGVSFNFNAWGGLNGGCYSDFKLDQNFGSRLLSLRKLPVTTSNLTIEGGALSTDGHGTVLLTAECVQNENRNNGKGADTIEHELRNKLGIRKIIWLPRGAAFDSDTDGHVDNIAIFIARCTVLLLWADKLQCAEQHSRSSEALHVLNNSRDADGNPLRVFCVNAPPHIRRTAEQTVPVMPHAKQRPTGEVLCASYVNLVIVENLVFAPKFGCPYADHNAFQQLSDAFQALGKQVVQIDARELILAGGGLHCISLGEPRPDAV